MWLRHRGAVSALLILVQIITQVFLPLFAVLPANAAQSITADNPEYLPNSGMLNSVATTLSSNHSDGIKSTVKGMATGKAASTAEEWLNQFGTARVNIAVDDDGKWDDSSLDLFTPLYDNKQSVWFTQFGLRAPDGRVTGNIGTGVRTYFLQNWMLGGNVFFDNDFTGKNRRVGFGAEAWTNYLKLSANTYVGTTNWHDSRDFDDYYEKPADGFDIRAEGFLPTYPQLGAKLMYEKYYGNKVALFDKDTLQHNPSAITTGLSYTPVPLISLAADYRQGQDSKSETKFQVNVRYDIGQNWRAQLDPNNVRAIRTLEGSRYDLVERNNQIILQYKKKTDQGVSNLALTTITDNAPADGLTENTLQVLATNRDNEPVRNAPIAWTTTGTARFASPMVVTNNDGIATATLTNTSPEVVRVSAQSGSVMTSVPSRFSEVVVSNVVLTITKDNSVADGKTANTAVATVTDINNRPIPNSKVSWAATAPSILVNPQLITNDSGQAITQLTSTAAGAFVLKIGAGGLTTEQTAHFVADNADAQITDFVVTTNNSPANGSTPNVALVTVKDPHGNPVSGVSVDISADKGTVSFASATARSVAMQTDSNGQLRVAFTDTTAEAVTVTVKLANGSAKAVTTTFSADSATAQIKNVTITKNSSAANGSTPNSAEVLVTDINGNAVSGAAVLWSADKSTVRFTSSSNTDAAGKTTVTFTDTVAETVTITAALSSGSSGTASAQFISDGATAQLQNLLVTKDGSAANGTAANTAEVYVLDGTGNPVSGQVVTWSADNAGVSFTAGGVTDVTGKATVSYTSTVAQSFQLNAALSNGNSISVASLFVADTASEQIAALDVTTGAIADGAAANSASVLVTDASNNPVANVAVTWTVNGSAVLSKGTGTTDADGKMMVTIADLKAETVNVTVSLSTGASQTKSVQFVGNMSTAQINTFTVTTGALANSTATNTGTVIVTDANNNPLSGITVTWGGSGSAILSASSSITDVNGSTSITVTDTKAESVTLTVTVASASQGQSMVFLANPGTVKIDNLVVTTGVLANGIAANTGTVTATDANNNPVSGITVNWRTTGSAILSSATSTINASGIATISLTDTVAESITLTASTNGTSSSQPAAFVADASTAIITQITTPVDQSLANGTAQNQVEVAVTDAYGNILQGETVAWGASSTDITIPVTSITDATGISRVNITSIQSGAFTITARLSTGSTQVITTTFRSVAVILPANITIESDNAPADGVHQNNILVVVTDNNNNPIAGQTVHFSATNGAIVTVVNPISNDDGITTAIAKSQTAGVSRITATLDNGSTASTNMTFAPATPLQLTDIEVNGHNFAVSSGFPQTGFIGATFQLTINGSTSDNSLYTWSADQSWLEVSNTGEVRFTSTPDSGNRSATISIVPDTGGPSLSYTFTIQNWFSHQNTTSDATTAASRCAAQGSAAAPYRSLTNAALESNGSRTIGNLWGEWGSMGAYGNGWQSDAYWAQEQFSTPGQYYAVNLSSGFLTNSLEDRPYYTVCIQ